MKSGEMKWLTLNTAKFKATQSGRQGEHLPTLLSSEEKPQTDSNSGETTLLPKVRTPRAYKVLLLNDDFTPMDFVVLVLQKFFKKDLQEAEKVMLEVHHQGAGVAGVYSKEVAEMKVHQVDQFAKSHQHPLKCVMEVE